MKSPSQYSFSQLPSVNIMRSAFRRPMTYKTTLKAGKLYPVYYEDVLPGDTVNCKSLTCFVRMMTLITPFMDNVYLDLHAWFVPNRLVWDNWSKLCGERDSPVSDYSQDTVYKVPRLVLSQGETFAVGSLGDYFGLPVGIAGQFKVDAMPFRAYNLIWSEFYRDENLQQPPFLTRSDNDDSLSNYNILPRGKRKDVFTSCLPWPQKGPSVMLPLGTSANVVGNGHALGLLTKSPAGTETRMALTSRGVLESTTSTQTALAYTASNVSSPVVGSSVSVTTNAVGRGLGIGVDTDPTKSGLIADLTTATATTINTIREAFQVQRMYENDARSGTRYQEILVGHFGVYAPDARLQRPEYLGGTTIPINVHTVPQSSATDSTSPQGNLAGFGTAGGALKFSKSFVEHGMLFVLASIRADMTYQQGIDRKWSRQTRFDYYWPALAHLGEAAVLRKEIFARGSATDDDVFGYQERWYEYKYSVSKVTGLLRSTANSGLDCWHLGYVWDPNNPPYLDSTFIEEDPPIQRVVAVQEEDHFLYDSYADMVWVRPMPMYCVPGLVDHVGRL